MPAVADLLSWVFIVTGGALGVIGGVGLLRFPDIYSRLHAVGVTDTGCAILILLGLGLQAGWSLESVKLFLIYAFLFFTSPTAAFALGNGAWQSGIQPWRKASDKDNNKKDGEPEAGRKDNHD